MKARAGIVATVAVGMSLLSGCGGGGLDDSATRACGLAKAGWDNSASWEDLVDAAKQSDNTAFRDLALEMEVQVNDARLSPEDDMRYVVPNYYDRFVSLCRDNGYE